MSKIIKYSITFIIFSIIISLFVLYFYLLKGFSIENIHSSFINIGKLYIKIDKKITLKAKNIEINYKNSEKNDSKELNFKKIKSIINKTVGGLKFIQEINIQNLTINKLKIDNVSFEKNIFIFNNKDLYLKTSLKSTKKDLLIKTYNLKIKPLNLDISNVYTILHFSKHQLKITTNIFYHSTKAICNMTITNKEKIFYQANIVDISKKTLTPFKDKLININNLKIYEIFINGDMNTLNFKIINSIITKNKNKIQIPIIRGRYNIKEQTIYSSNKHLYLIINKNKINLLDTTLHYKIDKNTGYIRNRSINIINKDANITLLKNRVFYSNKLSSINSRKINIYNKLLNINSKNLKAQYINKHIYTYIPHIHLKGFKSDCNISNAVLIYNKKSIYADIPLINILNPNISTQLKNTTLNFKNFKIDSNIKKIHINTYGLKGNILENNIHFDIKKNKVNISSKTALMQYLKIKNIKLNNITAEFNNSILTSNINNAYANNIAVSNINTILKNDILNVTFQTQTLLSKKLNELLSNFKINIPIHQTDGENNTSVKLTYNIKKSQFHTYLKTNVKNSTLMLTKTTSLKIPYANLELNDSIIKLKHSLIKYKESIINTKYYIRKGIINLDKFYIQTYGKFYDLNISNITDIKNYPENIHIDLNGIDIFLENLKVAILLHKNIIINIDKLSKFYSYIDYLKKYKLEDGKSKIIIGNKINIDSNITKTSQKILYKNLKPIKKINIHTIIDDNNYTISNPNIKLKIQDFNNSMKISGTYKNLDINVTQFVDENNTDNNSSTNISAKIKAFNTYILYHKFKLYSTNLNIDYNNSYAKIVSLYQDRNITINYNDGAFKLYGLNIRDKTFKDLTNSDVLNNPLITFFAMKNKNSNFIQGFVEIKKGYIKDLKAFNNILAFINLIPSLITFQPAGFSLKGYKIKHGYIKYILNNNILELKQIKIKGENMSFEGEGYIDLKKKTMDIKVNINLIVKLIKDIPIVNYILLGKNGSITLNVTVKGDINNPSIHKNTISNIIKAPMGILKRLILTPFRPFMKKEDK